jgi:hypothetical protein
MKKRFLLLIVALTAALTASAQDNFIFEMPDDFADLDTLQHPARFKSIHMIGVSYGVNYSGVTSSPKIGHEKIWTYNSIGVYYTYYHALWDQLFNFGIQFGAKHGYEGYTSSWGTLGETCEVIEVPLISQFKIDFSVFRLLVNLGTYGGYRLSTDKEGGFDKFDQRYDYGVIGGGGVAIVFKPFELHLEANYKYAFASMYHTNKLSDIYWLYTYPQNVMLSASLHFHLW